MSIDRIRLKSIVESLIFVSDSPLPLTKIRAVLEGAPAGDIKAAIDELAEDYRRDGRGIYLEEVAMGYQLRTNSENSDWIKKLVETKPQKLSKPALETLAIIAYNQPITRPELEAVRGVDSAGPVGNLLEKKLIRILGRKDAPGKPFLFGTTKEFLELFNLVDLSALPSLKEIESLTDKDLESFEGAGGKPADGETPIPGDQPIAESPSAESEPPDDIPSGDEENLSDYENADADDEYERSGDGDDIPDDDIDDDDDLDDEDDEDDDEDEDADSEEDELDDPTDDEEDES